MPSSDRRTPDSHSLDLDNEYFVDRIFVINAARPDRRDAEYEELKRLIVFAAVGFLCIVIFILLKFQISLDDIFKWSPVVWLIGVVVCGLMMNLFLHVRRCIKKRRSRRLRRQRNLLYSLNLPSSFPCLAPPPHDHECRHYHRAPILTSTDECPVPDYEQAMCQGRSWLLSRAAFPSQLKPLPPTYSSLSLAPGSAQQQHRSTEPAPSQMACPPPAYDDSTDSNARDSSNTEPTQ